VDTVTGHFSWIKEYWPLVIFSIGAVGGWIIWAMRRVFTTHSVMHGCKTEMLNSLETHEREEIIRSLEFKRENATQHQELRNDLRQIIDHLMNNPYK
jgi:hypothetical protein